MGVISLPRCGHLTCSPFPSLFASACARVFVSWLLFCSFRFTCLSRSLSSLRLFLAKLTRSFRFIFFHSLFHSSRYKFSLLNGYSLLCLHVVACIAHLAEIKRWGYGQKPRGHRPNLLLGRILEATDGEGRSHELAASFSELHSSCPTTSYPIACFPRIAIAAPSTYGHSSFNLPQVSQDAVKLAEKSLHCVLRVQNYTLPPEVLEKILVFAVRGDFFSQKLFESSSNDIGEGSSWSDRVQLTFVCSILRFTALSCPDFWASIPLLHLIEFPRFPKMVERLRFSPLSLKLGRCCRQRSPKPRLGGRGWGREVSAVLAFYHLQLSWPWCLILLG